MTPEQYFIQSKLDGQEPDKHEKRRPNFDFYDLCDFAKQYHEYMISCDAVSDTVSDAVNGAVPCQHRNTKHVTELDCYPYGDNCEYDQCEDCGQTFNYKVQ